ncbi:hypothetical protein CQW23_17590 [Capsicum baccatum]|uniref:Ubiquitin-like protease family profile domain-containing protein n=1 Tax=Capsicum baccatum TaxID=33114 RepID=A0A2G2WE95_CAPBA|nr:hypothetical protein CQW23_17590 [Capsicum baccatum]
MTDYILHKKGNKTKKGRTPTSGMNQPNKSSVKIKSFDPKSGEFLDTVNLKPNPSMDAKAAYSSGKDNNSSKTDHSNLGQPNSNKNGKRLMSSNATFGPSNESHGPFFQHSNYAWAQNSTFPGIELCYKENFSASSKECSYSNIVPTVEELEQLDLPQLSFASYHLGTSSTSSSTGDPNQMSYKDNVPQVAIDYDSFEDFSTTFPQYFKIDSINVFGSICAHKPKNEKSTVVGRTTDLLMQTVHRKTQTNQLKWRRNCGVFVAVYAEYLSKELVISSSDIDAQYHRLRYASLLCKYGSVKAEKEYFSENDDPPRSRNRFTTKEKDRVLHIE